MKDLQTTDQTRTVKEVAQQAGQITKLMQSVMKQDSHYGIIPGTKKPALYKAGAEKLMVMFNLVAEIEDEREDLPDGHREYSAKAIITHAPTGTYRATGLAVCSTMESKYRYRNQGGFEVMDAEIPEDYQQNKRRYFSQGFGAKKIDGIWRWVRYTETERIENPDIADTYNTIRKMAKKRALVDGVITATAATDIFAQDEEYGYEDPIDSVDPIDPVDPTGSQSTQSTQSTGADPVQELYLKIISRVNEIDDTEMKKQAMNSANKCRAERNIDGLKNTLAFLNGEEPLPGSDPKDVTPDQDPTNVTPQDNGLF